MIAANPSSRHDYGINIDPQDVNQYFSWKPAFDAIRIDPNNPPDTPRATGGKATGLEELVREIDGVPTITGEMDRTLEIKNPTFMIS